MTKLEKRFNAGRKKDAASAKFTMPLGREERFPTRERGETAAAGPAPGYMVPEKGTVPETTTLPIYQKDTYTPAAGYGAWEQDMSCG